jgi:hypothetical protein
MEVDDIFAFEGGRTVFVGAVSDPFPHIGSCECDVFAEGHAIAHLRIEGEMMPSSSPDPRMRAVSTVDQVDVARLRKESGLRLVCRQDD